MGMDKEQKLPKRKDLRLRQYDYSPAGAYFVTMCIEDGKRIRSNIIKPSPTNEMLPHIISTFKRFCNKLQITFFNADLWGILFAAVRIEEQEPNTFTKILCVGTMTSYTQKNRGMG